MSGSETTRYVSMCSSLCIFRTQNKKITQMNRYLHVDTYYINQLAFLKFWEALFAYFCLFYLLFIFLSYCYLKTPQK